MVSATTRGGLFVFNKLKAKRKIIMLQIAIFGLVVYGIAWAVGKGLKKEDPKKFATRWTLIIGGAFLAVIVASMIYTYFALVS